MLDTKLVQRIHRPIIKSGNSCAFEQHRPRVGAGDFVKWALRLDHRPKVGDFIDWLEWTRRNGYQLVGFIPDEGETNIAQILSARIHADRDADLQLGLFTNVAPGETITEATITEPTGTGYARIALVDATWNVSGNPATMDYPQQTFTAGAGGWTGSVQGYFINTNSAGGTKRIHYIEVDGNGPYTFNENDTYKVTPNISWDNA